MSTGTVVPQSGRKLVTTVTYVGAQMSLQVPRLCEELQAAVERTVHVLCLTLLGLYLLVAWQQSRPSALHSLMLRPTVWKYLISFLRVVVLCPSFSSDSSNACIL